MTTRYLSENAYPETVEYLVAAGDTVCLIPATGVAAAAPAPHCTAPVSVPIADHADLYYCRLGITGDSPVIHALPGELAPGYPQEAAFNAVCTGRYFLHNTNLTNPRLLAAARDLGLEIIHARQGYTRCSTIPVSENALITYDRGIALSAHKRDINVLVVEPRHVLLPGYDTGLLGGTCGNLEGHTLLFNGDLTTHPDYPKITEFASSYGLICKWIPGKPLRDFGSIR